MKCYNHPEEDAIGTCTSCGKAICQSCSVNIAGKLVCQSCLSSGNAPNLQKTSKPYNPLSIVSIILGIIGLISCLCYGLGGILFGIPAAIIGYIAKKQLMNSKTNQEGLQLANVGFWLGISEAALSLAAWLFIFIFYGAVFFTTLLQQWNYTNGW